jgi:hypothetical protein
MNTPVIIEVYGDGKKIQESSTSFLGPVKKERIQHEED